jgi:SH3 domain
LIQESTSDRPSHDTGISGAVFENQADNAPVAIDYAVATQNHNPTNGNAEYPRQISISEGDRIVVYSYSGEHWANVQNYTTGETGSVWLYYIALDSAVR